MKIPATMATQHPDSASRYVSIQEEADEALACLLPAPAGLGIEEIMVDFEGKMTPYHQTAEIAHKLLAKGYIPGEHIFITPRISSATEETIFRQLMALMSIIEADHEILKLAGKGSIKEIILPMVKGADDLLNLKNKISDILDLAHKEFGLSKDPDSIQVIPLVETIPTMLNFGNLYKDYYSRLSDKSKPKDQRFMVGRSDSALSFGLIPSVMATKIMIQQAFSAGEELGVQFHPIMGGGALPFRGHISPDNNKFLLDDFPGVRTVTIQSGLRYDHDRKEVTEFVDKLKKRLATASFTELSSGELDFAHNALGVFSSSYINDIRKITPLIIGISDLLPRQRDRLTRKSGIAYSRSSISAKELLPYFKSSTMRDILTNTPEFEYGELPRAITFTGALYSTGLPPEFLGLGKGLRSLIKEFGKNAAADLFHVYKGMKADLTKASAYLNLDIAEKFFGKDYANRLREDIEFSQNTLDIKLLDNQDRTYSTLLEIVQPLLRSILAETTISPEDETLLNTCIKRLGKLRKSLG